MLTSKLIWKLKGNKINVSTIYSLQFFKQTNWKYASFLRCLLNIVFFQHELVNLDFIEYSFIDDVLADMKITPDKIEIPIPAYFKRDRAEELAYWDNIMKETLAKMGVKKGVEETRFMEK